MKTELCPDDKRHIFFMPPTAAFRGLFIYLLKICLAVILALNFTAYMVSPVFSATSDIPLPQAEQKAQNTPGDGAFRGAVNGGTVPGQPLFLPAPALNEQGKGEQKKQVDTTKITEPLSLTGFFECFLDESFSLTVSQVMNEAFFAHKNDNLLTDRMANLPLRAGALWLRFNIAPMPSGMEEQVYLYPGSGIYGEISAWMTRPGADEPITMRPDNEGRFSLLYSQAGGTVYLRFENFSAINFAPWLDIDHKFSYFVQIKNTLCFILALAALICLLRGVREKREWRIWAALFSLSSLGAARFGAPLISYGEIKLPEEIPGVLAPALAMFSLSHVGRCLLQPKKTMPWLDSLFIFVSLVGFSLVIIPLIPGKSWLLRFYPLWPLFFVTSIFLCVPGWQKGLAGWGRFFVAALFAISGSVFLLFFSLTDRSENSLWISLFPLVGLVLSGMILCVVGGYPLPKATVDLRGARHKSRAYKGYAKDESVPEASFDKLTISLPNLPESEEKKLKTRGITDNSPLNLNAPLKMASAASLSLRGGEGMDLSPDFSADLKIPDPAVLTSLEETLRVPLDALLREVIALDMSDLPEEVRAHVKEMVKAGRKLGDIITSISRNGLPQPGRSGIEKAYIDLPVLLRDAHAFVTKPAEKKNLAVSWYVAPHLGRRYIGPAGKLAHVLRLLMESAVQATDRGSVQLWVRRVPESNNPGELVFTVADTGAGMPPERRNPLLPATLWELAGETRGSLHINSGTTGTTISFSITLKALPAHSSPPVSEDISGRGGGQIILPSLRLILADDMPSRRQLLAYMLEDLPHEIIEARSPLEAKDLHEEIPARLIIFDGNMPEKDIIDAVAAIRTYEGEQSLPPVALMALTGHEVQAERLRVAGVDNILYKPVNRAILRQAVLRLAPVPGLTTDLIPDAVPAEPVSEDISVSEADAPDLEGSLKINGQNYTEKDKAGQEKQDDEISTVQNNSPNTLPGIPADTRAGNLTDTLTDSAEGLSLDITPNTATEAFLSASSEPVAKSMIKATSSDALENIGGKKNRIMQQFLGIFPGKKKTTSPFGSMEDKKQTKKRYGRKTKRQDLDEDISNLSLSGSDASNLSTEGQLSENGVGEPMPLSVPAAPGKKDEVIETYLSENGVGDPMPLVQEKTTEMQAEVPEPLKIQGQLSEPLTDKPDNNGEEKAKDKSPQIDLALLDLIEEVESPNMADLPEFISHNKEDEDKGQDSESDTESGTEQTAKTELTAASVQDDISNVDLPLMNFGPDFEQINLSRSGEIQGEIQGEVQSEISAPKEDHSEIIYAALLQNIDDALMRLKDSLSNGDVSGVIAASGAIAEQSEIFGLHILESLARDIQKMAETKDGLVAVSEAISDLQNAVERNKKAFTRQG